VSDLDPLSPISSTFMMEEKDAQQWGQFAQMSSDKGLSGSTRRKSNNFKFTNDAENITISSGEEPKFEQVKSRQFECSQSNSFILNIFFSKSRF